MRRSSSTTSRWGASSGRAADTVVMARIPWRSAAVAHAHRAGVRRARSARAMNRSTESRWSALIMAVRSRQAASCAFGPSSRQRARDAHRLQPGELHRQRLAFGRDVEQALPAVVRALLLHHVALVDELLEHATERLLGDLQDVEQLRDLHAGIAVDEMQHAVVGAPEAELRQHVVGIADEVAIGEEQELDDVPDRLVRHVPRGLAGGTTDRLQAGQLGQPY